MTDKSVYKQEVKAILVRIGMECGLCYRAVVDFAGRAAEELALDDRESFDRNESIERRNASILAEYNGRNRDDLLKKYGISRRTFYRVLLNRGA